MKQLIVLNQKNQLKTWKDPKNFVLFFSLIFKGGQRNWAQVICNGGVATEFAIIILMDIGVGEQIIDFEVLPHISWLCTCVIGAIACCCGDTLASELGTVYAKGQPRLITTFSKVPVGMYNLWEINNLVKLYFVLT